ncbi:SDR family oxidoreductase [Cypionkella sp.]|uniref:SDR family NAD(P)-dependent oxidoreductase n=1 Tax=Cypionkella sp. TaxID=2811411 RepID=UPI0026131988|nr:SDR family NAD(P)-dependent oxidoreductase [Cypionkella sp.]MDB5664348.1 family NAD(P)-dependent oxidoreductase [Cypionkella sp.]
MTDAKLAVITGASSGIGLELARCAVADGCEIIICSDEDAIHSVEQDLRTRGAKVTAVLADLGTPEGIEELFAVVGDRQVDYMLANAGRGRGDAFLNQSEADIDEVLRVNVIGTTDLLHRTVRMMRATGEGRILITGSIAGWMPGSYQAVYNATKAYVDLLSWAIRNEVNDSDITVTCLMPGATDTEFFERAQMLDTPIGRDETKDDPAMVAREGYAAMLDGRSGITTGFMNKVQSVLSGLIPDSILASRHRKMAKPDGDGQNV